MILRRLELQAFGSFRDETVTFAPGMNLVSGPNGTGKTTLAQAVTAVLFGAEDTRYLPWDDPRVCRAALELEAENRQVRVERDFVSGCVEWFEADNEGHFESVFCGYPENEGANGDRRTYLSRLQDLTGIRRGERFRVLFSGDPSDARSGCCPERLKACFTAAESSELHGVLQSLQAEFLALSGDNPWGLQAADEGQLEQVVRRLSALEQEWFAIQEAIRQCPQDEAPASGDDPDAGVPAEDQPATEAMPDRPASALVEGAEPAASPDPVSVSADVAGRRRELEAELEKTGLPRHIPDQLPQLLAEAAEVRQAMAEQKRALDGRRGERRRCRPPGLKKPLLALSGMWTAGGAWSFAQATLLPVWVALPVTGLAAGWYAWRCLQVRNAGQALDSETAVMEAGVEKLREQLADVTDRFEALGLAPSPVEMVRMQKNLSRHCRLLEELRKLEEQPPGDADVERQILASEASELPQNGFNEGAPAGQDEMPAAAVTVTDAVCRPADRLEELLESRTRVEVEGEMLRVRESRLKRRLRTLRMACELLDGTLAESSGADIEVFARHLEQNLGELSAGAIDRARITPEYVVELHEAEGGWLPVERFGSATRTLVQVALYLAFNALYGETARLPLLFDDPLQALDKKRRGQVLKVLEQCAPDQQVILFSHDESLRRRATRDGWHLVSLRSQGPPVAASSEEKNQDDGQLSFL